MTESRPRSQPETQEEADEARRRITVFWPEHVTHLSPEGNRMGSGAIVGKAGVVCNCGDVLGFPPEQDPEEYLAQTENVGDEADPAEAAWNDLMAAGDAGAPEVAEAARVAGGGHPEGPEGPPTQGDIPESVYTVCPECGFEALSPNEWDEHLRSHSDPPWDTSDGPGPTKLDTTGGGKDDPVGDDPADEHASRTETVVHLPEDDRNDMYAASAKGTLPVRATNSGVIPADPLSARVVTIDPSQPYSPADVELQLLEVENKLERGMHWQRYWEERSAAADMEWEIIYNKARVKVMNHGGSEKDRHALCLQQPGVELAYREQKLASAMVRMARESMHNLRSLQSGYQTLSRSVENSYRGRQPGA